MVEVLTTLHYARPLWLLHLGHQDGSTAGRWLRIESAAS